MAKVRLTPGQAEKLGLAPDGPAAVVAAYCRARGYPAPTPEHRFCPGRRFAFDLAFVPEKVAVEFEGGIYGRGRPCPACGRRPVAGHGSVERLKSDMEKYNLAAVAGWRVVRVRPEQVRSGEAFGWLDRVFGGGPGVGRPHPGV